MNACIPSLCPQDWVSSRPFYLTRACLDAKACTALAPPPPPYNDQAGGARRRRTLLGAVPQGAEAVSINPSCSYAEPVPTTTVWQGVLRLADGADRWYQLVNRHNGQCLVVAGSLDQTNDAGSEYGLVLSGSHRCAATLCNCGHWTACYGLVLANGGCQLAPLPAPAADTPQRCCPHLPSCRHPHYRFVQTIWPPATARAPGPPAMPNSCASSGTRRAGTRTASCSRTRPTQRVAASGWCPSTRVSQGCLFPN